jgi:hypothetical protein
LVTPIRHTLALAVALAATLTACDHTTPFAPGAYGPGAPRDSANPALLTLNVGVNERPVWLADGSSFYYTEQRADRPDHDRCLVLMPRDGGTITREICDNTAGGDDSLNVFETPAIAADGRLALYETSTRIGVPQLSPNFSALGLTRLDRPVDVRVLQATTFFGPTSRPVNAISNIRWVTPTSLLFLGERTIYRFCLGCVADSVRSGQEIDRIDIGGATPVVTALAGIDQASSFALVGGDSLFYTLNGDANVYLRVLPSVTDSVVHTFGGIVRDVSVAGGRLAAVVGGDVAFFYDSTQSVVVQVDHGGDLHVVTLATGADTMISDTLHTRRPALDPAGTRLVAEARDGVNGDRSSLWLWKLP